MPALQGPKWQPYTNTHPLNKINKFKPEASTELWEQQPSEQLPTNVPYRLVLCSAMYPSIKSRSKKPEISQSKVLAKRLWKKR